MHVLNVSLKNVIGGTPQVCMDYTNALISQSVRVTTIINKKDPFADFHRKMGARVEYAKFTGTLGCYDPIAITYFAFLLQKIKPDVIIAHDGRAMSLCCAGACGKVPIIDVNHGRAVRQSRKTAGTIVINPQQLVHTKAALPEKKNIVYIPNMVDIGKIELPPEKGSISWQNPPVIGALGRLVNEKAFDVLIDAFAILKAQNVPFRAIIGGDGLLKNAIAEQIVNKQLQQHVELYGWVDNPEEFYKKMDIFCLSSRREACPKVLLEAMKYGVPVVVTDAEGPCDIIRGGYDGIMVEKENPTALAAGLKKMLEDKNATEILYKNAYKTIIENYSVPVVGKKLLAMIEQVVKKELV